MEESPEADLQALQAFRKKASAELAKFKAEHSEIGRQTEQHDKMTLQLEEEANKMRKRMEGTQYYLLDKDLPVFRNTANAIAADRPDYSESLQTKFVGLSKSCGLILEALIYQGLRQTLFEGGRRHVC